jgi:nicotinamide-nucleotide amidase
VADIEELVIQLGKALERQAWSMTAAESCTGGWLAKLVTDVAGSSAWFERGFVTYSNAAKVEMLGVSTQTLAEHGAVSEATVQEMAAGALRHSHAQLSVSISGIAGPGGATEGKPVGTVWMAWAWQNQCRTDCFHFAGDRDAVREAAVVAALRGLLVILSEQC